MSTRRERRKKVLLLLAPVVALLAAEGTLRCLQRPRGTYRPYFELEARSPVLGANGRVHLFEPEREVALEMFSPLFQYQVRTNNLGLRGRDASLTPDQGTFRIACVGDSITHGMFVSSPYSFPEHLDEMYRQAGRAVEVLNVGECGAGIGRETELLKTIALPLKPALVLLTFVTNDLLDVQREADRAAKRPFAGLRSGPMRTFVRWFLTDTALGESLMDLWISARTSEQRRAEVQEVERGGQSAPQGSRLDASLEEEGTKRGHEFQANAQKFLERYRDADGMALTESASPAAESLWNGYVQGLRAFAEQTRQAEAGLVLVYFPAYPQVYLETQRAWIVERLTAVCQELAIPFLDLTDSLRAEDGQVLHYAPVDYHLNRPGNRVVAQRLLELLDARGLVPR